MSKTRRFIDKLLGTSHRMNDTKRGHSRAARLLQSAGAGLAASMEQLEQRQMLFTLQVTAANSQPDANNPGFGTTTVNFGYFIPFLSASIPGFQQDARTTEDFDQRAAGALGPNLGAEAFFGRLAASGAGVLSQITPLIAPATGNQLNLTIPAGGWIEFTFRSGNTPGNNAPRTLVGFEWRGGNPPGLQIDARGFNAQTGASTTLAGGANLAVTDRPSDPNTPGSPIIHGVRFDGGFQVVRLTNSTGAPLNFAIDNATAVTPSARFAAYLSSRLFGAQLTLYGRIETAPGANDGTAVQLFDLYGRDMTQTINMGVPQGATRLIADASDDGIPDFNEGIGRISLVRGDARAGVSLVGGTIAANAGGGFDFTLAEGNLAAAFRAGGFALEGSYVNGTWQFRGFEDASATVIVGSPWIRDNRNPVVYFGGIDAGGNVGFDTNLGDVQGGPGVALRIDDNTITQNVRVFGAVNRPQNNPAGAFVRYSYANGQNWYGLTSTLLESQLAPVNVSPLPAFPGALPNPPAPQPAPAPVTPTEQGIQFDPAVLAANRVWGQFAVDGLLFGQQRFNGSLSRVVASALVGNLIVEGDLGVLIVNGNLGGTRQPGSTAPADAYRTFGSQVTVGRSLGQVLVSGRIIGTPITVLGATNDPNRATTEFLRYSEIERVQYISNQLTAQQAAQTISGSLAALDGTAAVLFGGSAANGGIYRNDLLPGAEFVGTGLRGAVITGTLGLGNSQFNTVDTSDVFAFTGSVGASISVAVQWQTGAQQDPNNNPVLVRVVDINGRTVATHPFPTTSPEAALPGNAYSARFNFVAPSTGVYYLVLSAQSDGDGEAQRQTSISYTATIQGQTAVTVGMISVAGGINGAGGPILVQNGSVGMVRIGNGFVGPDGAMGALSTNLQTVEQIADYLSTTALQLTVAGGVNQIILGSDMRPGTNINVGGNLGALYTGRWFTTDNEGTNQAGGAFGNVLASNITVGGSIGRIEVSGSVGWQNTTTGRQGGPRGGGAPVVLRTGASSGVTAVPGHIGEFSIGGTLIGQDFTLRTSDNSIIDRWVIGANPAAQPFQGFGQVALGAPNWQLGSGSDIRFFTFQGFTSDVPGSVLDGDFARTFNYSNPITINDDSGAQYTIAFAGGAGAQRLNSTGIVYLLPIGNATLTGRVDVATGPLGLLGGASLLVTSNSGSLGRVSLGRVDVDGGTGTSNVIFQGSGEIDVYELNALGTYTQIRNATIGGDIVSVDVGALGSLLIDYGSLGSTETNSVGDRRLGIYRGLQSGLVQNVGGALGLNPNVTTVPANQGGGGGGGGQDPDLLTYIPVQVGANTATIEDVGAPFDGWLNGLVVRTGNLSSVSVGNQMGDVILQGGGNATLGTVIANPRGLTGDGVFRGINGVIYAGSINAVDIGDGIRSAGPTSLAQAGIFAENDIGRVYGGGRIRNPIVNGVIVAANSNPAFVAGGPGLNGINSIDITGGTFDGVYIGVARLDSFWDSTRQRGLNGGFASNDPPAALGALHSLRITGTDFSRSSVFASTISNITISGGAWNASRVQAQGSGGLADPQNNLTPGSIGTITADRFVNTTLDGEVGEFRQSSITASGDLNLLTTTGLQGDLSDIQVTVGRNLTQQIAVRNIIGSSFSISGRTSYVYAVNDIRSTTFTSGALSVMFIGRNVTASSINVTGAITQLYAIGDMTNVSVSSTGAGGGISFLYSRSFSGSITSSGNISTIYAVGGDISGTITTTGAGSSISYIYSTRDLNLSLNVSGDIGTIYAARNIGRRLIDGQTGAASTPDVIDVRGNITTVQAGGQLYADLRVGQSITGLVYVGFSSPVFALPGSAGSDRASDATISAFGRIAGVYWFGDFGGRIVSQSGGVGYLYFINGSVRNLGVDGLGQRINSIDVRDGDLGTLYISGGHLLGNVNVRDGNLTTLYVLGDAIFGNIGVDPNLSLTSTTGVAASQNRAQLPPGTTDPTTVNGNGIQDGPVIRAGRDIGTIYITGGIYESSIIAGRNVGSVTVTRGTDSNFAANTATGTTTPSFIVAGDQVQQVTVYRLASGLFVGAGITDLGADLRPGGTLTNTDTVRQGNVAGAGFYAGTSNVVIVAGMNAGADGLYTQGNDDTAAAGSSTIGNISVTGAVGVRAWTDTSIGFATAGVVTGGGAFTGSTYAPAITSDPRVLTAVPGAHTALVQSVATAFTTGSGETGTVSFSGPGQAFFDAATMSLVLVGSTAGSTLTFNNTGGSTTISGLRIRSLNNASLASLTINSTLQGNSGIFVDGTIGAFSATGVDITSNATFGTGVIGAGGGIGSFTSGTFSRGILQTGGSDGTIAGLRADAAISSINITGNFGNGAGVANRRIQGLSLGSLSVSGTLGGVVSITRDIGSIAVTGQANAAGVRAGGSISSFSAGSANTLRLSAGGGIGTVSLNGDVIDSQIAGGADLGTDGQWGGTGSAADTVRSGGVGSVNVAGNFQRSDVTGGLLRGADGFFGSADDTASDGRANVGPVTIAGTTVGSLSNSQQYRVAATGTVGTLRIAGTAVTGQGNFQSAQSATINAPIQITQLRVEQVGGTYQAVFTFNQPIADAASLLQALTIREVRGTLAARTLLPALTGGLAGTPGVDYTVSYNALSQTATVVFSTTITNRNLTNNTAGADTVQAALASPGTYLFSIAATGVNRLRGATNDATLDGNNDGVSGDNFNATDIVGDAGDRSTPFTGQTGVGNFVSLYPPVNLDLLLSRQDANSLTNRLNTNVTVRGTIGDHPDFNVNGFDIGSDADLYSLTLRAGQILRLGALTGAASGATIFLVNGTQRALNNGSVTQLNDGSLYVNVTGTYIVLVSTAATANALVPPQNPPPAQINTQNLANNGSAAGQIGAYSFTVSISDDGNTGFRDTTVAGGLAPVGGNAGVPLPGAFNPTRTNTVTVAGQTAGTQYIYRYTSGADGILDNADDRIVGQLRQTSTGDYLGILSLRSAGVDGVLGNGDDVIELVNASGAGTDVVTAPRPSDFVGTAAALNQPGNLPFINVGNYVFRLDPGANGVFNGDGTAGVASDDVVIGTDSFGNTIERRAGTDGVFSNAVGNDDLTTLRGSVTEANPQGPAGNTVTDVDIYNLNNGLPIQPGTRYRLTLRANEDGGNFGRLVPQATTFSGIRGVTVSDLRGQVQFALFDTTGSTGINDGLVSMAPSGVQYFGGGTANTTLANNGITRYGYDSRGDFFMEFTVAPRQNAANPGNTAVDWARLSLYVQGVVRSNYSVEMQQLTSVTPPAVNTQQVTQNILIETRGGTINWLEAGGRSTNLIAYDPADNGFTGVYGGTNALNYLTTTNAAVNANSLVRQLQAIFNAITGFTPGGQPLVRISANPADFEGQAFSTVFLSSSQEPAAFFGNGQFGAVQRVDIGNANIRDQSVVFMPALNALGNQSSQTQLDTFTRQLTTIVGRQIGQLLGLRTERAINGGDVAPFSAMASGATDVGVGNTYAYNNTNTNLNRTNATAAFLLGQQNAQRLLQRIFYAQ